MNKVAVFYARVEARIERSILFVRNLRHADAQVRPWNRDELNRDVVVNRDAFALLPRFAGHNFKRVVGRDGRREAHNGRRFVEGRRFDGCVGIVVKLERVCA